MGNTFGPSRIAVLVALLSLVGTTGCLSMANVQDSLVVKTFPGGATVSIDDGQIVDHTCAEVKAFGYGYVFLGSRVRDGAICEITLAGYETHRTTIRTHLSAGRLVGSIILNLWNADLGVIIDAGNGCLMAYDYVPPGDKDFLKLKPTGRD